MKSSRTILVQKISEGMGEYDRPVLGLGLSALAAGLEIGFSVLLMAAMLGIAHGHFSEAVTDILVANMYAFGFILVILGRSELFTEHTALAVLPVLQGSYPFRSLLRVWSVVFIGNIVGCFAFSGLLAWRTGAQPVLEPWTYGEIGREMTEASAPAILLSATLAGWLMGQMGWCVVAAGDTISRVFCVWMIAAAIGFAKLHHCIVGSVEVLAGVFNTEALTLGDFGHFLLWATLGNLLGGVIFVALIKYGHASRAQTD
jgi:formate/nitrite transporter FocA (FNT family)